MKDQDEHRRHDWEITYTNRDFTNGFIEYERCRKCNAKHVVQYPPGMTLDSDPKPMPKYCEMDENEENMVE